MQLSCSCCRHTASAALNLAREGSLSSVDGLSGRGKHEILALDTLSEGVVDHIPAGLEQQDVDNAKESTPPQQAIDR